MKKFIALILALVMALGMVACAQAPAEPTTPSVDINAKSEGVMTYAEYMAAELEAEVNIEFFVQGSQGWWFDSDAGHGKITVYGQDGDGGYFCYELNCDEDTSKKIVPGAKIAVKGYKAAWAGEIEVMDGTVTVLEGDTYIADALDVTEYLGKDELVNYQNMFVSFKGMTVVSQEYKDAQQGNDIYLTVSKDGAEYSFCVESYLTGPDSDTYKAVEALKAGDVVDVEGFLYWYEGVNTHITAVKAAA